MKVENKFFKSLKRFRKDEGGNVLIISTIVLFVLLSSVGAAMEYARLANSKSDMLNALDAAVLATGVQLTNGERDQAKLRNEFNAFFFANLKGANQNEYNVTSFFADPETGEVNANVERTVKASIMKAVGYDEFTVKATSEGVFDRTDVEVAMMLDVTGSMRGQKIRDLKLAAKDAVNILLPDSQKKTTRIALVPYASSVNAGKYADDVTVGNTLQNVASNNVTDPSMNTNNNRYNCVTGRGGRDANTDEYVTSTPLGSDIRTADNSNSFFRCPRQAEIQPLTNNASELRSQIDRYRASGYTAGHLGIAWSYYLLSEKWAPLFNNAKNKPAAYSKNVQKIAILMTDGEFNTAYEGVTNNPFGAQNAKSEARARGLCSNMKALKDGNPGIIIYSVAFQAPSSAEHLLKNCANTDTADTTYYYAADNGQELRQAFQSIAASISKLRISQ
jgi:Flp pilus assembly protein TadG